MNTQQIKTALATHIKLVILSIVVLSMLGTFTYSQSLAANGTIKAICSVFVTIIDVIFLLGLSLMLLGATIYAGANIMPAQQRGGMQGYGMAMIIGGVVGVAIAVAAPFVLGLVVNAGGLGTVISSTTGTGIKSLCTGTYTYNF